MMLKALVGALACMGSTAHLCLAQQTEVTAELGASHFLQPAGIPGEAAQFLMGGLRGSWTTVAGSGVHAALLGGWAASDSSGGDFLSGEASWNAWMKVGSRWAAGVRGRGVGFLVASPFSYRAGALEAGPAFAFLGEDLSVTLEGTAGVGRSRGKYSFLLSGDERGGMTGRGHHGGPGNPGPGDSTALAVVQEDLWRAGGRLEALGRVGPIVAGVGGSIHDTSGGLFRSAGLRMQGTMSRVAVGARLNTWWVPGGRETVAALAVSLPLGDGWSLRGFLGRTEPDPLTLATSSGGGTGVMIGRRLAASGREAPTAPLHRVVEHSPSAAMVRFTLRVPGEAERVELMGDFTLWEARAMDRNGESWTLELEVPNGLYHYGFLLDGEWFVPSEAEDVVPDEWGRQSVTLLVEGGEG